MITHSVELITHSVELIGYSNHMGTAAFDTPQPTTRGEPA